MTDQAADAPEEKKKGGLMPMLIAFVATLVVGGGGFFVSYTGVFPPAPEVEEESAEDMNGPKEKKELAALPDVAFVQLDPLLVTLAGPGPPRYVRFGAQLEVPSGSEGEVTTLMPRILDVLNGYLRALELEDVQKPTALLILRAHMLRRVELVVGEGRVRDLLVTEFVIN